METSIVCFGEMLWDMLPEGAMPGGAPMNVAIHLKYQGYAPKIISKVGGDDLGTALLDFLRGKGLSTEGIQIGKTHLTGVVKANVTNRNEVVYKIVKPVAWDYIQYDKQMAALVAESEVFIYGSLAARSTATRQTLLRLLKQARLKVFDVNFRPPHYRRSRVEELLEYAHIVKMNHHELAEIMSWYAEHQTEQKSMAFLRSHFNLQTLVVTRGENGAIVLDRDGFAEHPGFQVAVEDTIGSGDAFLATFLHHHFQRDPMPQALENACLVGALVASQKGATPLIEPAAKHNLMQAAPGKASS
jgi:fructokinase